MELEKTTEGNKAFQIATQVASFMIDRLNGQPYVIDLPKIDEIDYEQMLLNYGEIDTRGL